MRKINKNSKSKKIMKVLPKVKAKSKKILPKTEQVGQLKRLLFVIAGILVVFGIFYGIAVLIDNKNKKEEVAGTEIQYDEILVGRLLEQPLSEYYVLVYFEIDSNIADYQTQISNYKSKANAIKIYSANLNNAFNKIYIGSKNDTKVTKIADFKLSETALIYIKNKKIAKVYTGSESINTQFAALLK